MIIGKMSLHALLNNCNGVPGISPAVVSYLISGKRDAVVAKVSLQDVPDFDLRKSLEKVLSRQGLVKIVCITNKYQFCMHLYCNPRRFHYILKNN